MSIGLPHDSPLESTAPLSLEGAGVLVVDEDPAFQLGLKTFLREFVGFSQVWVARSGREAIGLLRERPEIQLMTLDYRMPELDGLGLLQRLRDEPLRPLAVVMITGYPSDRLEEEFRSFHSPMLRTEHFVKKPVDFGMLEPVLLRAYESLRTAPNPAPASAAPPLKGGVEAAALKAAVAEAVAAHATVFEGAHLARLDALEVSLQGKLAALGEMLGALEKMAGFRPRTVSPPGLLRTVFAVMIALGLTGLLAYVAHRLGWDLRAAEWIDRAIDTLAPLAAPAAPAA